jgi:hypothetical protein
LGAKFLVVLCAGFTLLLGEDTPTIFLAPLSGVSRSQQASPSEVWLSPTVLINLGFTTEGRLAVVLIIPSSWGSQRAVTYKPSTSFLAPLPGRKKTSARGVSHAQSFTLFLFLLYFIFACIFLSKIQKISSFIVAFTCLLLVLLEWYS